MRFLVILLVLVLPLFSCTKAEKEVAVSPPEKFQEGVHYSVVDGQPKPDRAGKIEVMEVFWYGCSHCVVFELLVNPWQKTLSDDVNFIRSPAIWPQANGVKEAMWTHAQVYYTAEALGVLAKVHPMFFQTIHKYKIRMVDHADIKRLMGKLELDGDEFLNVLNSPAIEEKVKAAEARLKTYKITGTPEMIVGGYYHVTAHKAGGQKGMLEVVDFLINKIRTERGSMQTK